MGKLLPLNSTMSFESKDNFLRLVRLQLLKVLSLFFQRLISQMSGKLFRAKAARLLLLRSSTLMFESVFQLKSEREFTELSLRSFSFNRVLLEKLTKGLLERSSVSRSGRRLWLKEVRLLQLALMMAIWEPGALLPSDGRSVEMVKDSILVSLNFSF